MRQETILIVDDDLDHQKRLSKRVKIAGYQSKIAWDLPQAIEILQAWWIDYMVLDAGFPMKIETLTGDTGRMATALLATIDSTGDLLVQLIQGRGLRLPKVILTNSDLPQAANVIGHTIWKFSEVICSTKKNDTTSWDQFIEKCRSSK